MKMMKLVLIFPTNKIFCQQPRNACIPMVGVSSIGHPKDIGIHSQRIILRDATDKTPLQPTRLLLVT